MSARGAGPAGGPACDRISAGNVTGVSIMTSALAAKRLGVLHEMLPKAVHNAVLGNSHTTRLRKGDPISGVRGRWLQFIASSAGNDGAWLAD